MAIYFQRLTLRQLLSHIQQAVS